MGELIVKIVEEGEGSAWRYVFKDQVSKKILDFLPIPTNKEKLGIKALSDGSIVIFELKTQKTLIKIKPVKDPR